MKEGLNTKKILYPEDTGEPIARQLKGLREQTYPVPASPENPDDIELPEYEKVKTEAYALTAYIIEKVHEIAFSKLREHKDTLSIKDTIQFPVPSSERVFQFDLERARTDYYYSKALRGNAEQAYVSAFVDALQEWSDSAKRGEGDALYDHRVYSRLNDLFTETSLVSTRKINPIHLVESFTIRGANTVGHVSFDILRAIPIAYYNAFGKTITAEEYREVARQAEALVIQLSSLHIQSFSRLMQFARAGKGVNRAIELEFPLELFSIENKNGVPRLKFDEFSLLQFEKYRQSRLGFSDGEVRLGCPARDARTSNASGEKNLSVVSSVYRFYEGIAESIIVPHLEAYTDDLLEKGTQPAKKLDFN